MQMRTARPCVLVIEDELRLAQCLSLELQDAGYDVTIAHSGPEGLNALMTQWFDLVVLDWNLPQLSGLEICQRLRAQQTLTPVVMMTAYDDVSRRKAAYHAGVDEYLIKPFSVDAIAQLLGRLSLQICAA